MNDLREIIEQHAIKYPLMQPCDAVKLIYQNEFGGGHLILDSNKSLEYLHREYKTIVQSKDDLLFDNIGNGIVRINLSAIDANNLSLKTLNEIFVLSSNSIHGSEESFLEKLKLLKEETIKGIFRFTLQVLQSYLTDYINSGITPVSHSIEYKKAYNPAYRVVMKSLL